MTTTATLADLERFAHGWTDAGLPKKSISPVLNAVARSQAIQAEADALAQESRATPVEVAGQIAVGDLTFADGLAEAAARHAYIQPVSPGNPASLGPALAADARGACHRTARTFLATNATHLAHESGDDPFIRGWLAEFAGLGT